MTVGELIQELKTYPPDARAMVQGYEDGYDEVSVVRSIRVHPNPQTEWYYGRWEETTENGESAVLLFGRGRYGDEASLE